MGAIIRQQYKDPIDKSIKIREMIIEVEQMRLTDAVGVESVTQLRVDPMHHHNNPHAPMFNPVFLSPKESLYSIIDGKRTNPSIACLRTRILQQNGLTFVVENLKDLKLNIGDPVAILSDLHDNGIKQFGIVQTISTDSFTLFETKATIPKFLRGAIIQNLANRWHKEEYIVGAKSQLSRPFVPTFEVFKTADNEVDVRVQMPINIGTLVCYDIYIRNHMFDHLEYHWVPDVINSPLSQNRCLVSTYNGGEEVGGGLIKSLPDTLFYCAVIAKDKTGFSNVNESACMCVPCHAKR